MHEAQGTYMGVVVIAHDEMHTLAIAISLSFKKWFISVAILWLEIALKWLKSGYI